MLVSSNLLQPLVVSKSHLSLKITPVGQREVIGQMIIGLSMGTFLLVVNDDHVSILHG